MQLDGLATGMDTTSIINQLVQLEAQPIQNYEEEISNLEQTKGAWRDVNSRLDKLEDRTTDLKMSSTFNSRSASSSNEDVVTATAENSSDEANYGVTVNQVATKQRLIGSRNEDYSAAADSTINLNGTEVDVKAGDSLSDISNNINDAESGYKASVIDNVLVLEAEETGVENALSDGSDSAATISADTDILKNLGIFNDTGAFANEKEATDAQIEINGITEIKSSTNTFSDAVDGVTFEINPEAEAGSFSSVSVSKDTGKATAAVQGFVDQYNSVMNFLDGKTEYDEEEQKGAVLQGDSTAMRLQTRLRDLVTSKVKDSGELKTLNAVGIEVDRDGVMSFDSSKFTEALNNSPEEVTNLFRANSETDGYNGMAEKMDTYLDQLMQSNTGLIPRRLDLYNNQIDSLNDDIEDVQRKVDMTRERYIKQFSAMEEAISEMQQQQNWMMSQLQGIGGSTNMMSSMM